MTWTSVVVVSLVVGASAVPAQAQEQATIRVYVSGGDPDSGFVEPATRDSANDLKGNLRGRSSLSVVDDRAAADIWIRVDRRLTRPSGSATAVKTGPQTAIGVPIEEQVIYVTLIAGDYSLEMVGNHTWSWKSAAGQVGKQVEKWAKENRDRLLALRSSGSKKE